MVSLRTRLAQAFAAFGKALCYLLLFLISQVLVSSGYTLTAALYANMNPGLKIDPTELTMLCTDQISLVSGLLTLLLVAVFFLLRHKNPLRETGFRATPARCVCAAGVMMPIVYAVIIFVLSVLPEAWLADYMEAAESLSQTGVIITVATIIVAPLVEEIIFRGLVLSRLRKGMSNWLAVVVSALLFGACHGQIVWICYAFVIGLLLGLIALRSGSIWPSLLAHILFNAIGQFSVYLPETDSAYWIFLGSLVLFSIIAMPIFHRGMTTLLFPRRRKEPAHE